MKSVRAYGPEHIVEVKPIPPEAHGNTWVPAEALSVSESWSTAPSQDTKNDPRPVIH